jgi:hypothetical protein
MMELIWRQTKVTWIAVIPEYDDERGQLITQKINQTIHTFCVRLLQYGGTHVVIPFNERDIKRLLRRGQLMSSPQVQMQPGELRQCHSNSANIWKKHRKICRIVTGYALTEDDRMWRQHSWVLHNDGYIIETTQPRCMYFVWYGLEYS